jgi:hypothetical protein
VNEFKEAFEEVEIIEQNRLTHYDFREIYGPSQRLPRGPPRLRVRNVASVRWNLETLIDAGEMVAPVLAG